MVAYGAYLGSGLAHYYVAAVTALPHALSRFFKYSVRFDVVKQGAIALLMGLLYSSNRTELFCKLFKAFFLASFAKVSYMSVHS